MPGPLHVAMGDGSLLLHDAGGAVHRGAAAADCEWPHGGHPLPVRQQAVHGIRGAGILAGAERATPAVRQQRVPHRAHVRRVQLLHRRQLLHHLQVQVPQVSTRR
eukprot:7221750-Pyramimonas_sp.AAC.1